MSSRSILAGVSLFTLVPSLCVLGGGCLTRPVVAGNPMPTTNFSEGYNTTTIDKIDILFDIDNSSSMGDKQQYLQQAIPDLVKRLVQPNCIHPDGSAVIVGGAQLVADATTGQCTMGQAEFPAVHDMHIGVVTSSLGGRGTTSICQTSATPGAVAEDYDEYTSGSYTDWQNQQLGGLQFISKNNDDQAHLINRVDSPATPDATPSALAGDFLAWAPPAAMDMAPTGGKTETVASDLEGDFQELVVGAQAYGCGIESQLESWYRFLVQPDPYQQIVTRPQSTDGGKSLLIASWEGLDTTILQQRADFLRPDSLVLIVVLSDENDSEIDVRSYGGAGVNWLDADFSPPRGTAACAANPADPDCTSCDFAGAGNDASCKMGNYTDNTDWGFNDNLRHVHMKQKYGVDLQFPISRYVQGLTQLKVPNRSGEYPAGAQNYQGGLSNDPQDLNCINPLFATGLPTTASGPDDPTLCNLTPSVGRTPTSKLVYYAHIGGVPNELLTTTVDGALTPKETLSMSDWTTILGADPENYDYSGIDPHMIESYQPRSGVPLDTAGPPVGDEAGDWVTDGEPSSTFPARGNLPVDREYACVFKLEDAMGNPAPRNCDPNNPDNAESDISSCDCSTPGPGNAPGPTLPADHVPSVCDKANPLQQDYAKAYPTIRELLLAQKLGTQGIVSSICPIHLTDNAASNDPLYGYRPAISSIIDRLKVSLNGACLPETLTQDDAGVVPCLVLVTLPTSTGQDDTVCSNASGKYPSLMAVDPTVLQEVKEDQAAAAQGGVTDLSQFTTCAIRQVLPGDFTGTCASNGAGASQGWCYITGTGSGTCPQSLQFSSNGLPKEGIVTLQCLEHSSNFASGNGS